MKIHFSLALILLGSLLSSPVQADWQLTGDPPYQILVLEVSFEDQEPATIASRYAEKGEIRMGKQEIFDDGIAFFQGKKVSLQTNPGQINANWPLVEVIIEELEKPSVDPETKLISQKSQKIKLLLEPEGKEYSIQLADGSELTIKAKAIGFDSNQIDLLDQEQENQHKQAPDAE